MQWQLQTKRTVGYKDDGVHDLAPPAPAESLNATSVHRQGSRQTKPALPLEGHSTGPREPGRIPALIPVLHQDGTPLTPCKPAKARKLLRGGVAEKRWNKLGHFYIQMRVETGKQIPEMWLADDPGSQFDGIAVASHQRVQTTAMLELPSGIAKKMTNRRQLRRARRYRKCRRRPKRFDNRHRPEGWTAPSQKAKVDFRLKVIGELYKLYPIAGAVVEDVRFNHYRNRWGKHFSTVEIGKAYFYAELKKLGQLKLYAGWETQEERERQGLKKSKSKRKRTPESHVVDAVAMLSRWLGTADLRVPQFWVFKRPKLRRRSLHVQNPAKGGVRRMHGGTVALGIRKNTVCLWRGQLYRTGGSTGGRLSLHDMTLEAKRVVRHAKVEELTLLFKQSIFGMEVKYKPNGLQPIPLSS
ncbi:MAG: RRXRR domain-containing protein [Candidatus Bipolaricaulia bacterium]